MGCLQPISRVITQPLDFIMGPNCQNWCHHKITIHPLLPPLILMTFFPYCRIDGGATPLLWDYLIIPCNHINSSSFNGLGTNTGGTASLGSRGTLRQEIPSHPGWLSHGDNHTGLQCTVEQITIKAQQELVSLM